VVHRNYQGVTHEFFGMAVLDKAKEAQALVQAHLLLAFAPPVVPTVLE
jgi:hypothetical protein